MIYVALLRGINVGGNNKVEMKKLKKTFDELGYKNVLTYINSGNIIFEASSKKPETLIAEIESGIIKDFGLDIKVLVRDAKNINLLCSALPDTWVKNEKMRTNVMFLWEEIDSPDIINHLQLNAVDNVKYIPGAVLWNIEDKNYAKSAMQKLVGTKIYKKMTIRNVNTLKKLDSLMAGTA